MNYESFVVICPDQRRPVADSEATATLAGSVGSPCSWVPCQSEPGTPAPRLQRARLAATPATSAFPAACRPAVRRVFRAARRRRSSVRSAPAIGTSAGMASRIPVHCRPTRLASRPSASEATGLLPAHAIAHTAITLASRSGPARLASSVLVAELAIRHVTPAPNAAAMLPQTHGESTKHIMHAASAASAVAASRSEGFAGTAGTTPVRCRAERGDEPSRPAIGHVQMAGERRTEHQDRVVGERHGRHHKQQDRRSASLVAR